MQKNFISNECKTEYKTESVTYNLITLCQPHLLNWDCTMVQCSVNTFYVQPMIPTFNYVFHKWAIYLLSLWLRLSNKSTQKTGLLGIDGRQIGPLDSTIVAWMADKSAELTVHIVHPMHEWSINRPWDYQPWKDENSCLSILGLVHKSRNSASWFSIVKILYIHLPCTLDRDKASILSSRNVSIKEKSLCQTVNMKEYTPCKVKVNKKLSPCQLEGND